MPWVFVFTGNVAAAGKRRFSRLFPPLVCHSLVFLFGLTGLSEVLIVAEDVVKEGVFLEDLFKGLVVDGGVDLQWQHILGVVHELGNGGH
jgi:hypothetical protein